MARIYTLRVQTCLGLISWEHMHHALHIAAPCIIYTALFHKLVPTGSGEYYPMPNLHTKSMGIPGREKIWYDIDRCESRERKIWKKIATEKHLV